jgi:hypothetical protein
MIVVQFGLIVYEYSLMTPVYVGHRAEHHIHPSAQRHACQICLLIVEPVRKRLEIRIFSQFNMIKFESEKLILITFEPENFLLFCQAQANLASPTARQVQDC